MATLFSKTEWHWAAKRGDAKEIERLSVLAYDVDARGDKGWTALMYAVQANRPEGGAALIKAGCSIEAKNNAGDTALIIAALHGHGEELDVLIRAGADLDALNHEGTCALSYAAKNEGHCLEMLIAEGAALDSAKEGALPIAVQYGKLENVKKLVKAGVELEGCGRDGLTALLLVANEGDAQLVALLLEVGAKIDPGGALGFTALHYAAVGGNPASLALIVAAGAEIDKPVETDGRTAAMWAARHGNRECLELLLGAGASWDALDFDGKSLIDWTLDSLGEDCKLVARAELERRALNAAVPDVAQVAGLRGLSKRV